MYPKLYIDLFRRFPRTDEVFVAMPFAEEFEPRWHEIYQPSVLSLGLEPYRVDGRRVSDSILTDILAGIGRSRLVLADASYQAFQGQQKVPNANVMYELGIAHSIRLPEEVIVVRDNLGASALPFDIGHIRCQSLDTENPIAGRAVLEQLLVSALNSIDVLRDMLVARALESLDIVEAYFMGTVGGFDAFDLAPFDPDRKGLYGIGYRDSSERELRGIARQLISLGLLTPGDPGPPGSFAYGGRAEYRVTELGSAVWQRLPGWSKQEA